MNESLFTSVLLVDDNEDDNFVHKRFLEIEGWSQQVDVCDSGPEVLELAQSGRLKHDVIFIDVNMPIMSGFELLDRLKEQGVTLDQTNVVMLTSSLHPVDRQQAAANPAVTAYVNKPMNGAVLNQLIHKLKVPSAS